MNALAAYDQGASGSGITVAVVDSGIDTDSPEFTGRIHIASLDLAGLLRGIDDTNGHGTSVAAIIGAARNDIGMHGAAPAATLLVLRTDRPGSCASSDGCQHDANDLARAIDVATLTGARVINMSLGGAAVNSTLRQAIARATAQGVVIVIAAGNDGAANPDPFAQVALDQAANGLVIIAGATTETRDLASFSNRAGNGATVYVAALGEHVRTIDHTGAAVLGSGTSFAAPGIAGAVALLLDAFPNLTGSQAVELIFNTADDAGAAGVDTVFGRGILNLTRAFQPQGSTSLASTGTTVSTTDNGDLGGALGDGGQIGSALQGVVVLDGFNRAFAFDLARTIAATPVGTSLNARLSDRTRQVTGGNANQSFSLSILTPTSTRPWLGLAQIGLDPEAATDRTHATSGYMTSRLGDTTRMGLAVGYAPETLLGVLGHHDWGGAYLVAVDPINDPGFTRRAATTAALSTDVGGWTLGLAAGHAKVANLRSTAINSIAGNVDTTTLFATRDLGPATIELSMSQLHESKTVLGSRVGSVLGLRGAVTHFAGIGAQAHLGGDLSIAAAVRLGRTDMKVTGLGLISNAETLTSLAFQFDVMKDGLFRPDDRLSFRLAQPLRVTDGQLRLDVPIDYDYATGAVSRTVRNVNLAPSGREIDAEMAYVRPLLGGELGTHLFWRHQPGHIATSADDMGMAIRFSLGF